MADKINDVDDPNGTGRDQENALPMQFDQNQGLKESLEPAQDIDQQPQTSDFDPQFQQSQNQNPMNHIAQSNMGVNINDMSQAQQLFSMQQ